jgi:RNA polymerase-binding transcription factor DksA
MSTLTMSQPNLMQRRAQLEGCWRARLERVTELALAYHDAAQLAEPGADRCGTARRLRMLARRTVTERQALAEIEAALQRLASGTYGQCEQCQMPVDPALLATEPQARYCTACVRPPAHRAG